MLAAILNNPEILLVLFTAAGWDGVRDLRRWRQRRALAALAARGRALPQLPRAGLSPLPDDAASIRADVATLRLRGDFATLADLARWAAAGNRACADGLRRHAHLIDAALADVRQLAERIGLGQATLAEKAELNGLLNTFTEAAEATRRGEIAGLAAMAHQLAANGYSGHPFGRRARRDDRRAWLALMDRAAALLARTGCAPEASIYLALPHWRGALASRDPAAEVKRRFETVLAVDARSEQVWIEQGRYLRPDWFGSDKEFARHAARAARVCEAPGLYARVIAANLPVGEMRFLPGFTFERMMAAIRDDLEARPRDHAHVNRWLRWVLGAYGPDIAAPLMRRYLKSVVLPMWPDEDAFMALYALAFGHSPAARQEALLLSRLQPA